MWKKSERMANVKQASVETELLGKTVRHTNKHQSDHAGHKASNIYLFRQDP